MAKKKRSVTIDGVDDVALMSAPVVAEESQGIAAGVGGKFDKRITTPFADTGLKLPFPDTPMGDGLINQQEGFTLKYRTPINAGGAYIKMENVNQIINETQTALKETQDKCVTSVNGVSADEAGNAILGNIVKSVNEISPDMDGNVTLANIPDVAKATGVLPVANGGTGRTDGKATGVTFQKNNDINIDTFTAQGATGAFFHTLDNNSQGTFPEDITVSGFYSVFNMGFANNADERDLGCNGQLLIMGTYVGMPTNSFVYYRPRVISSQGALEWGQWRRVVLSGDVIPISDGGTGATTAEEARQTLGVLPIPHLDTSKVGAWWMRVKTGYIGDRFTKIILPNGGTWVAWTIEFYSASAPGHAPSFDPPSSHLQAGGSVIYDRSDMLDVCALAIAYRIA